MFLLFDGDATYILLGRDHPSVKAWITRMPVTEADEVPVPLAAVTWAQSQMLEVEEIANQVADIRDGREPKQLPP